MKSIPEQKIHNTIKTEQLELTLVLSSQGGSKNSKFKVMKLEWLLIRPVLNTKTVVQQDSVKVLHDNRNALK